MELKHKECFIPNFINHYGLQGVSTDDASLPEDEIIGAARDLYEKVTAAP